MFTQEDFENILSKKLDNETYQIIMPNIKKLFDIIALQTLHTYELQNKKSNSEKFEEVINRAIKKKGIYAI